MKTPKPPVRTLKIDRQYYTWRHRLRAEGNRQIALLTIYPQSNPEGPLRVEFTQHPAEPHGFITAPGLVHHRPTGLELNLNQAALITNIIRQAILNGWNPLTDNTPFTIQASPQWASSLFEPNSSEPVA